MSTDTKAVASEPLTTAEMESTMTGIKRMLKIGAAFAVVGYLLVGFALFLEISAFHPLLEEFFATHTGWSLAGGGADRAGEAALNSQLATIHSFPSVLLWLKLGGVAHVLVGIFIALAAIVRTLALMPHRLAHEMGGE
ncbi:hypothetical protein ABNG03_11600 [Halorubrum sp. RMP-47]|uniref:DUF1634 domain-containing protein n=1 Tax=Halorubrum miltondacostae TaxID=3076378 RepID=A0ABD5M680_9EURY